MITKSKIKHAASDRIFYNVSAFFMLSLVIVIAYPLIYVLSASFSSGNAVAGGKVLLWPVEFSLEGYKTVFRNQEFIRSFFNTIFYTVTGATLNVFMAMTCAYALSRANLKGRNFFMFIFAFTMFFNGGIIPFYILLKDLGLLNSIWAMILPGALSVYNMIIARTFIQSNIPSELHESASMDGCSDTKFFMSIVLPLSKAVIAVIALFSAVNIWNSYFGALMFLNDRDLYPVQIILREILVMNQIDTSTIDPELQLKLAGLADVLKYSLIVVASAPILLVYPFVQKYFIKGVMIGSLKG
jgi:putative aldouronate transport system permease protein